MFLFYYTGTQNITFKLTIKAKSREEASEKFQKIWLNCQIANDCCWDIEEGEIVEDNFDEAIDQDWRIED